MCDDVSSSAWTRLGGAMSGNPIDRAMDSCVRWLWYFVIEDRECLCFLVIVILVH